MSEICLGNYPMYMDKEIVSSKFFSSLVDSSVGVIVTRVKSEENPDLYKLETYIGVCREGNTEMEDIIRIIDWGTKVREEFRDEDNKIVSITFSEI
jgi:hypothetical protein